MRPVFEKSLDDIRIVKELLNNPEDINQLLGRLQVSYLNNGYNLKQGNFTSKSRFSSYLLTAGESTNGEAIKEFYDLHVKIMSGDLGACENFSPKVLPVVKEIVNYCYEKLGLTKRV